MTDASHTKAKIVEIRADRLREALDDGHIVLVAGFQGVSTERNVTTLGRGGSDTTAVALAAALGARRLRDLHRRDRRVHRRPARGAGRPQAPSGEPRGDARDGGDPGSRVLALRSVEFARRHDVPLHVRSSFLPEEGTWITKETPDMEKAIVTGLAHRSDEAKVTDRRAWRTAPASPRASSRRWPT